MSVPSHRFGTITFLYAVAATASKWLLWFSAACIALMVSVTMAEIILRYFFSIPLPWANEAARTLFVWAVMLGIAIATWSNAHIAVKIVGDVWFSTFKQGGRVIASCGIVVLSLLLLIEGTHFAHVNLTNITPGLEISLSFATAGIAVGGLFMCLFSALTLLEECSPRFREAGQRVRAGRSTS
ncbi:TRAP transporter small permease [Shumkonia mesophila]|uniref:TRAP transporter small permease n=1 Tax=Shumkonia mesophila TaxID=2838854 RepID=UPI002934183E|nr:TRAP transporter small permease subunit [Shumkonia mesophila]